MGVLINTRMTRKPTYKVCTQVVGRLENGVLSLLMTRGRYDCTFHIPLDLSPA